MCYSESVFECELVTDRKKSARVVELELWEWQRSLHRYLAAVRCKVVAEAVAT